MGLICNCPLGAALPDIPEHNCPTTFGQIQKVIFQRMKSSGALNGVAVTGAKTLSTWTALKAVSDSTKISISPYINAPATEPGAMRTYGGGNDTVDGIELNLGTEPTKFSGTLLREHSDTIAALKELMCEGELGVYLVDEHGCIGGCADNLSSPTKIMPIAIQSFFVGDLNLGGFDAPDSNAISWSFKPNWSDALIRVVPEGWNPLTDL